MRPSAHTSALAMGPLKPWARPCTFISFPAIQVRKAKAPSVALLAVVIPKTCSLSMLRRFSPFLTTGVSAKSVWMSG